MKKGILITVNAVLVALGVFFAVFYSTHLRTERTEMTRSAFISTVDAMKQVSMNYLQAQQDFVDSWGSYLEQEDMTSEEALQTLTGIAADDGSSFQLIDKETMTGYSTKADVLDATNRTVSYETYDEDFRSTLLALADESSGSSLHITNAFNNQIDGLTVVAFGRGVSLEDDGAGQRDYILLRLVLLSELQDRWIFPTGYEDAEIGLITADGSYVVRTDAMKSENFLEFIRAYNNLTYPQKDELQQVLENNSSGVLEYKDARGQDAYWAYTTLVEDSTDWMLVGYVPVDSLDDSGTDWTMVIVVCVFLAILILVDGAYLLMINRKLRESVEVANMASEAKTRFLSSMSHDIRTPMNAITGMTAIALRHIDDQERVTDCLNKITLASDHLLTLINDILDISRVESGKLVLNPSVFSLADLMTNLANMIRPQVHAKQLEFNIRIFPMTHEYLNADKLRLNQIFINILSNAVKYTPSGGTVTLTLEELETADEERVRLVYTVADTGIGMSQEFLKTMFQPFTRAVDTRTDTIEGAGLGLAITKQMVDAMNGTIDVESELGKGSTFKVTLELDAAQKAAEPEVLPPMRILVADDDPIFLESVTDTLETLGVEADTASGGAGAISMAAEAHDEQNDYSVIILDWKMPEVDGVAAARGIREKVGDEVPIIILSAFDWSDIEDEAIAAGVTGFINKPVFRSTLYAKVTELLGIQRQQAAPREDLSAEKLRGMHLLVAEDNDMNWEIAKELLAFYGITADRAENGEVCVKMLSEAAANTYAMVLMDIQMPVMNGWDAAKVIRASALPHVRNIPIIAMTADAFAEDVRRSLEVGMNGHVSKPIDMKLLIAEMKKVGKEVAK